MRGPGTPLPADPGLPPSTHISPAFSLLRPTMQLSNVVLPHPLAPSRPYLEKKLTIPFYKNVLEHVAIIKDKTPYKKYEARQINGIIIKSKHRVIQTNLTNDFAE